MILNRSEIRYRVRQLVGDSSTGIGTIFTDATYNRTIQDAFSMIFRDLPFAQGEQLIDTVADQAQYNCTELTVIEHVDYDDKPLEIITANRMFALRDRWQTDPSGEPLFAIMGFKNERLVNNGTDYRQFTLYPAPATSAVTLRCIGKLRPLELLHDFQSPAIPFFLHEAIVYEAAARILEMRTEMHNQGLSATLRGMGQWYVGFGQKLLNNRDLNAQTVVGNSPRTNMRLKRETHIPYTGIAPGTAE